MTDVPERDPLADLVSRSVGARVDSVDVEILPSETGVERKRLRFDTTAGATSAIFERRQRGDVLEAQLLPFLARKTPHVPVVHSRGLPPPAASLGPWLLIEDVYADEVGCPGDVRDTVRAKLAIERAVANDLPALRALGVRQFTALDLIESDRRGNAAELDSAQLDGLPRVLVHGRFSCANTRVLKRGVVVVDWSRAYIGCGLSDIAQLARWLDQNGRSDDVAIALRTYRSEGAPAITDLDVQAALRYAATLEVAGLKR